MKITIYELLGMIKDGKAPKEVKSEGHYYTYNELEKDYYEGMGYSKGLIFKHETYLSLAELQAINKQVEELGWNNE